MEALKRLLPKPGRDWVAKALTETLVRGGIERRSIEYDREQFALRYGSETSFLANLYADCCCAWPWQRRARVERFARLRVGFRQETEPFADARERLLPGVRDRYMFEAISLLARADGNKAPGHPYRPLGARLAVGLVVDGEESMRIVSDRDLEDWGLSAADAFALAAENLGRRPRQLQPAGPGVYVAPWADCHVPSRLVLPEVLGGLDVEGELVAVAPNWNHLIVTGGRHDAAVASAIEFAMKVAAEEPKPMSALPIVKRDGEWVTLELPRGHPVEPLLRKARVIEMAGLYEDQKQLLDRVHEREGTDVFVASFTGVRDGETDGHTSYCMWAKGIVSLLPRTEEIVFHDDDRPEGRKVVARIDWDIVELHCKPLMKAIDQGLPRYEVSDFPSPEQLDAMAQAQALRAAAS